MNNVIIRVSIPRDTFPPVIKVAGKSFKTTS